MHASTTSERPAVTDGGMQSAGGGSRANASRALGELPPVQWQVPSYRLVGQTLRLAGLVVALGGLCLILALALVRVDESVPMVGRVLPARVMPVRVVTAGQVAEVFVETGTFVRAGEPLAKLRAPALEESIVAAEAEVAALRAARQLMAARAGPERDAEAAALSDVVAKQRMARAALREQEVLQGIGTTLSRVPMANRSSENVALERAGAEVERVRAESLAVVARQRLAATASLALAEVDARIAGHVASLRVLEQRRAALVVRAPVGGRVLTDALRSRLVGVAVEAGATLLEIGDEVEWQVEAAVSQSLVHRLRPGQRAYVEVQDGNGIGRRRMSAEVREVGVAPWGTGVSVPEVPVTLNGTPRYRVVLAMARSDDAAEATSIYTGFAVQGRVVLARVPLWRAVATRLWGAP